MRIMVRVVVRELVMRAVEALHTARDLLVFVCVCVCVCVVAGAERAAAPWLGEAGSGGEDTHTRTHTQHTAHLLSRA